MALPDRPEGDCPRCGGADWEYGEWSVWVGYRCEGCELGVILGR